MYKIIIKQIVYSNMFDKYLILAVMVRESRDVRGTHRPPEQSTGTAETVYTVTCTPLQCRKGTIRDGNTNHAGRILRQWPCQVVNWKMPKSVKTIHTYATDCVVSVSVGVYLVIEYSIV